LFIFTKLNLIMGHPTNQYCFNLDGQKYGWTPKANVLGKQTVICQSLFPP